MTHEECLLVNDFQFGERAPWHEPSEEWNVPEPDPVDNYAEDGYTCEGCGGQVTPQQLDVMPPVKLTSPYGIDITACPYCVEQRDADWTVKGE